MDHPLSSSGAVKTRQPLHVQEKFRIMHKQLRFIIHAAKCQKREANSPQHQCPVPDCRTIKNVLVHIRTCQAERNCTMERCFIAKQIIRHWKSCSRPNCPICSPLKGGTVLSQRSNVNNAPNGNTVGLHDLNSAVNIPEENKRACNVFGSPHQTDIENSEVRIISNTQLSSQQPNSIEVLPPQLPDQSQNLVRTRVESVTPLHTEHDYCVVKSSPFEAGNNYNGNIIASKGINFPPVGNAAGLNGLKSADNISEEYKRACGALGLTYPSDATQNPAGSTNINTQLFHHHPITPLSTPTWLQSSPYQPSKAITPDVETINPPQHFSSYYSQSPPFPAENKHIGDIITSNGIPFHKDASDPTPTTVQDSSANWRHALTPYLRDHMRKKFVKSVFPIQLSEVSAQQSEARERVRSMTVEHAKEVEISAFKTAKCKDEYYYKLAENIYKIRTECDDKRKQRICNEEQTCLNSNGPIHQSERAPPSYQQVVHSMAPAPIPNNSLQPNSLFTPSFRSSAVEVRVSEAQAMPPVKSFCFRPHLAPENVMQSTASSDFYLPNLEQDPVVEVLQKQKHRQLQQTPRSELMTTSVSEISMETTSSSWTSSQIGGIVSDGATVSESVCVDYVPSPPSVSLPPAPSEPCVSSDVLCSANKQQKYPFTPEELRNYLKPSLETLTKLPESIPFQQPVDPEALGIPDYFEIVKKPMDLSVIRQKLNLAQYTDPWDYINDVGLMFENAWLYNRKTSVVYRYCTKLSEIFRVEIDKVMQELGYCCGQKYSFDPPALSCFGKQLCSVQKDGKYYSYQDRYTFCYKCFHHIKEDTVMVRDELGQPLENLKKNQFVETKNDGVESEPFVECEDCGRKLHQICVLHVDALERFTCDGCLKKNKCKGKENEFTAKNLRKTELSEFMEARIDEFLKKNDAGAGKVYIRVVSSSEKVVEVKPGMKKTLLNSGDLIKTFPYRAKAIFAFQNIDGAEVCFFGLHVQEYGSECPYPNTRRIYISYLDSVHFFQPKKFRTSVYHEILLGYLEFAKRVGYTTAHIWACPPSDGDDYIFHCHPREQKFLKPKKLVDWYNKMLDKGFVEKIVVDYKDILTQAQEENLNSVAQMPYFEGDFWPTVLEESIKELEQEEEEKRRHAEVDESAVCAASSLIELQSEEMEVATERKGLKKVKRSSKFKGNQRKNRKKTNGHPTGSDLLSKMYALMEKHREVFVVVHLHPAGSATSLPPIQDPDPVRACHLMDSRDSFLTAARDNHYEFSTLRRAKFSTMAVLFELQSLLYRCNDCKNRVESRYHCNVCDDFDLCADCFQKMGHPHKMEFVCNDLSNNKTSTSSSHQKPNNPEERRQLILQCIRNLSHACLCKNANCSVRSCHNMKRIVAHTRICQQKTSGGCSTCKQLSFLCGYHVKHCSETKCQVPFCANMKQKLKQRKVQQNQLLLKRRMQVMKQMDGSGNSEISNSVAAVLPGGPKSSVPQTSPQFSQKMVGQHIKGAHDSKQLAHLVQHPNQNRTHHQHLQETSNPVALFGPSKPIVLSRNEQISTVLTPTPQPHEPAEIFGRAPNHVMPTVRSVNSVLPVHNSNMGVVLGPLHQSGQATSNQMLLHQVLQALRGGTIVERQQQVLQILRSNPNLLAAFRRHQEQQQLQIQATSQQQARIQDSHQQGMGNVPEIHFRQIIQDQPRSNNAQNQG